MYFQNLNIFGIRSNFSIRDNTGVVVHDQDKGCQQPKSVLSLVQCSVLLKHEGSNFSAFEKAREALHVTRGPSSNPEGIAARLSTFLAA